MLIYLLSLTLTLEMLIIDLYAGWRFGFVGNVVGRISEVNQRRAWLVLGWVTVDRRENHLTGHPGELSLAIPTWVGKMSTSESWDVSRHTAHCTLAVVSQYKLVSG